ncbi:unnamed protein product [Darwinula stevensoni]|uniref:Mediator of RNA polymerase II transcription subunit 13 n=1 Tax=Darwinula stevensoni TaxID=69355 RepID=A0A7R8XGP7_9CRUS|nr:unnamed protein product [Darwinula stevensoni]CAG0892736.1 unnamed protein product [Darwinula stevensoni]
MNSVHLSFSFSFFVHGESTVCASLDVRQHPPVHWLNRQYLQAAEASQNVHVILAPNGLAGTLSGQAYQVGDQGVQQLVEDWRKFYPLGECGAEKGKRGPAGPDLVSSWDKENRLGLEEGKRGVASEPLPPVVEVVLGKLHLSISSAVSGVSGFTWEVCLWSLTVCWDGGLIESQRYGGVDHGVRMKYPTRYVLLTEMDETPGMQSLLQPGGSAGSHQHSHAISSRRSLKPLIDGNEVTAGNKHPLESRVWQDGCVSGGTPFAPVHASGGCGNGEGDGEGSGQGNGSDSAGNWEFAEVHQTRPSCSFSKCRRLGKLGRTSHVGSGVSRKAGERTSSKKFGSGSSFHQQRAPPQGEELGPAAFMLDSEMLSAPHRSGSGPPSQGAGSMMPPVGLATPGPCSGGGGVPTPYAGYKVGTPGSVSGLRGMGSVGSPGSVGPSPLPTPHSHHSQPPSVSNVGEGMMPTLSPHPLLHSVPEPPLSEGVPLGKTSPPTPSNPPGSAPPLNPNPPSSSSASALAAAHPDPASSVPMDLKPPASNQEKEKESSSWESQNAAVDGSTVVPPPRGSSGTGTSSGGSATTAAALARPHLPVNEYEFQGAKEELACESFYDYSLVQAWANLPVKRHEPRSVLDLPRPSYASQSGSDDPGGSQDGESQGGTTEGGPDSQDRTGQDLGGGFLKRDPYAFDDDTEAHVSMDGFGRNPKEECPGNLFEGGIPNALSPAPPKSKPPSGNLFTSKGLEPSMSDLDHMFDDDNSGDETLQVPTPPGSNEPPLLFPDTSLRPQKTTPSSLVTNPSSSIHCPAELSKMFPTPPSHEHNTTLSPCSAPEISSLSLDTYSGEMGRETIMVMSNGSVQATIHHRPEPMHVEQSPSGAEAAIRLSPVYGLSTVAVMVGSVKYAPLALLPSQKLPPLKIAPDFEMTYRPSPPMNPMPPQYPSMPLIEKHIPSSHMNSMLGGAGGQIFHRPGLSPISPAPTSLHYTDNPPSYRSGPGSAGPSPGAAMSPYLKGNHSVEPPLGSGGHPHQHMLPPYHPRPHPHMMGGHQPPPMFHQPQAHSLLLNLILYDSLLNLFRDHNFDSCTLCVCNAGSNVVGNLKGGDGNLYLPDSVRNTPGAPLGMYSDSDGDDGGDRCLCGYSAVVNRRRAHGSGLFYEDEVDMTGLREDSAYDRGRPSLVLVLLAAAGQSHLQRPPSERDLKVLDNVPESVVQLLNHQCQILQNPFSLIVGMCSLYESSPTQRMNLVELRDASEVVHAALEQAKQAYLHPHHPHPPSKPPGLVVHHWGFLHYPGPSTNYEIVRVMKSLQPLLQDAIQKKRTVRLWEATYNVSGPLTWRQLHRLAGRGTEDQCEPQPIPSLLIGHDKDWLTLSPLSLRFWEHMLLEPYSSPRDIVYVVVSPDNSAVISRTLTFFRELSSMYQLCRLGKLCPIVSCLRDGILRVGKKTVAQLASEPEDEWFATLGDSQLATHLRLYAQACKHNLAPLLATQSLDSSLLEGEATANAGPPRPAMDRPQPSPGPMPPPPTPENIDKPGTPKPEASDDGNRIEKEERGASESPEEEDSHPPGLVIYMIDPFTYAMGSGSSGVMPGRPSPPQIELHRLVAIALFRCFQLIVRQLPEHMQSNIYLQIIPLEKILGVTEDPQMRGSSHNQLLKGLAFSVFSQTRPHMSQMTAIKSLTGFGPAASTDNLLKAKDVGINSTLPSVQPTKFSIDVGWRFPGQEKLRLSRPKYNPPYILAPIKEKSKETGDSLTSKLPNDRSWVLFVSYCLSEDQKWLLAAATDDRGELLETTMININIPFRSRRRKASARRMGLQKLMDFILSVMSDGVHPWRLVVGRLGRVGHGELKSWSSLLGRKSLQRHSRQLKQMCSQCRCLPSSETLALVSACFVSMEPDSSHRMMPDQFTPDERFGGNSSSSRSHLSTPQDVSCTHILVFPTSATTQSSQAIFQEKHMEMQETFVDNDTIFEGINIDEIDELFGNDPNTDILGGITSPVGGSPRGTGLASPHGQGSPLGAGLGMDHNSPFPGGIQRNILSSLAADPQEELEVLHQQPLALGYYVSTAPLGVLPKWFWASCPHRAPPFLNQGSPNGTTFLKAALHLHSHMTGDGQGGDNDFILPPNPSGSKVHPLDSDKTTDVLRFVLEGYNGLSWLSLDTAKNDRRSCLPIHMQVLVHMHNSVANLL